MKKVLKRQVENFLTGIEFAIIAFFCTTVESMGNTAYDIIAFVIMVVFVLVAIVLIKYGKDFD